MASLLALLASHSVTAWADGTRLLAVHEFSVNGVAGCEVVELPVDRRAVLVFLGY